MIRLHPSSIRRFALCFALIFAFTAVAISMADPAGAGTTPAQDERRLLTLVNQERQARGLAPLVSDAAFAETARAWAAHMGGEGRLSHDPDLTRDAAQVEPRWRSVAENVGFAGSVDRVHQLLMESSGHRANILAAKSNRIGIGIVHQGGRVWVTQRFLEGPAITGPTGLGPCVGTRTSAGTVAAADLDGDGADDLLVHGPSSAPDEIFQGSDRRVFAQTDTSIGGDYIPLTGDFTGSGTNSVLFYAAGSAPDYISRWNGSSFSSTPVQINGHYTPTVGDLDGDGRDDIIWYAPGTHPDYIWYGTATTGKFVSQTIRANGHYRLVVADLDGNGQDDITWHAPGYAKDYIHMRTGTRTFKSIPTTINGNYQPAAGDFDADGLDDIIWHGPGGAKDYVWYGKAKLGSYHSVPVTANGHYRPVTGDFDGDCHSDIVWTDGASAAGAPVWFGKAARSTFDNGRV